MVLINTLHNVRQRNIVYSKALRDVCLNITYSNTLHNVRQRNIVLRANVNTLALLHKEKNGSKWNVLYH